MEKNLYDVLGLDRNASQDDIKKAYKKLSMQYHPDRNGGSKESEEKFKEVSNAYQILSDEGKKRQYDTFGSTDFGGQRGGGGQHFYDMQDIFSQFGDIFGGRYGRGQQQRRPQRRGNDLRVQINVELEEVMFGAKKKVKYKRQKPCDPCQGKGGSELKNCLACGGSGHRMVVQQTPFGVIQQSAPCSNCGASGQVVSNPCKTCGGHGTIGIEEIVDIDVPKGVASGMTLNLGGYGNFVRDGIPGDLQVVIEEIPHPKFKREGNDLHYKQIITIPDAVLGAKVEIPAIGGRIQFDIPAGCESGKKFMIGGKGTPVLRNDGVAVGQGSLFVEVAIQIPKVLNDKQKLLFTELQKEL